MRCRIKTETEHNEMENIAQIFVLRFNIFEPVPEPQRLRHVCVCFRFFSRRPLSLQIYDNELVSTYTKCQCGRLATAQDAN